MGEAEARAIFQAVTERAVEADVGKPDQRHRADQRLREQQRRDAETERAVALIRRLTEGRTLLIVEHDMSVVFGLADHISVLVYGHIIASGTPEDIRNNPKVKEAYLGEEVD